MAATVDSVRASRLDLAGFVALARVATAALAAGLPVRFDETSEVAFFAVMIESLRGEVKMPGTGLHSLKFFRNLPFCLHTTFIRILFEYGLNVHYFFLPSAATQKCHLYTIFRRSKRLR